MADSNRGGGMTMWQWMWRIAGWALLAWTATAPSHAAASLPSVAFYYGDNPPLSDLQAFDIAVVEPAHVRNPRATARAAADGGHELFAYVSLGEVQPSRPYYSRLPKDALRGDNAAWGSRVIDQAAPGWRDFFLNTIIAPLWEQGWRGFFLDTLDSYQLFATTDAERARQTAAMVATLREFKRRYPEARLMFNRGFELLPEVSPLVYAVAAESLYQGYDAGRNAYRPVPEQDREWLMAQMKTARDRYKLPVIAIDYVTPENRASRELARSTAARIMADGFIPWVADGGLVSLGVGSIEVVPRTVLVLVDTGNKLDFHYTDAQRFLGIQLNHLGLKYEFLDLAAAPLPTAPLTGRYAGVVTWFENKVGNTALAPWLAARAREGMRLVVFDRFGFALDGATAAALDIVPFRAPRPDRLTVQAMDKEMVGFESAPFPNRDDVIPIRLAENKGRSLLRLADNRGNHYDTAALTPWGGYVLTPFAIGRSQLSEYASWVVHPLKFLKAALALPDLPVPDVTTEGGRRMLLAHIDGDGFASRAELPGAPFSAEVIKKDILERYRIPTTVSVIEGELSSQGLYRNLTDKLEPIAQSIFALPYVEGASHSYSHPFTWAEAVASMRARAAGQEQAPKKVFNLRLPGYEFDLARETRGSMDYINNRLMPKGKTASVFLWSGDCVPPAQAIEETYRHGFLNLNGGDAAINPNSTTWTTLASQGLRKNGWYQVFAPNQNENVYTNGWTGPFYGYEQVIAAFKVAESPVRFKPVNIYYHFYSGTKPAGLEALHKVYRWAAAQPLTHVYASEYIRKVLDFENTSIARDLASGDILVRTGTALRTLRMPSGLAAPSLSASTGVAGFAPG
ncbi:bifunctional glycoside hydrolase 114/ polysaccharide deacetylase family protein, partial [Noviherbaspirillum sp.]|uniref:bifunctional glycoside hydrolase 114/ polysaccharide deacetylase family protein n=1 Tax=Noviherbaspirillum sp. TaxID=1926288 RepID=UPI002FE26416